MKPIKFILILFLTQVTACSYFFPDKEKDYVYSKENKPLDMPPDLQAEESLPELDPDLLPVTLSNTITHIDDGTATYLRINSPFAHAWRVVGKALTVNPVEITDKNRATAIYYVQYDPDAPVVEDDSFWSKSFFSFGANANNGKPYQIFLTQTEKGTEIFVRDDFGDTVNHGDGLQLLNLLYVTIDKDFSPDIAPDLQAEESLTELDPVMPVAVSNANTQVADETEVYSPDSQSEEPLTELDPVLPVAVRNANTQVDDEIEVYSPDSQAEESLTELDPVMPVAVSNANTQVDDETEIYSPDSQSEEPLTELDPVLPVAVSNTNTHIDGETEVYSSDLQSEEPLTELDPVMPVAVSNTDTHVDDETEVHSPDVQVEEPLPESDPVLNTETLGKDTILLVDDGGEVYLRVNSPFAHAWRVVGKALTASSIEITDKNRVTAIYYVQYDPDAQVVEDGSFWEEVVFFFGDDPNQELPYQVLLTETEQGTTIVVRDDFGDPLNHGNGLKLLNLLHETIEDDFAR